MIAAAAAATTGAPPAAGGLPFNWFDLAVVAVLGFGIWRGRHNGMSKEVFPLLEWLVLVPLCALAYRPIAGYLAGFIPDALWNCLLAYVGLALVVLLIFKILKDMLAEKLVKSDFFKGGEYYFGMLSGLVRYACVVMAVLALLNAPVYSKDEIAQMAAYDEKNFGGGLFSGNYFPHMYQVQDAVFKDSFLGPLIKNNAGILLITTGKSDSGNTAPDKSAPPPKPKPVIIIGGQIQTNLPAPAK